jgi:hypothetical protein
MPICGLGGGEMEREEKRLLIIMEAEIRIIRQK